MKTIFETFYWITVGTVSGLVLIAAINLVVCGPVLLYLWLRKRLTGK
jgi:hypothetical protein